MANTVADDVKALTDQVAATVGTEKSVVAFINGIPALIQAAVDKATSLPELHVALADLTGQLKASGDVLAASIVAAPAPAPVDPPPAGGQA